MRPNDGTYRADIDGLRAIAVGAVLLFHAFPGRLTGGFAGVDVFFVISGFLITGIIDRRLTESRFRLADFYAARVRRIFPALIVVMVTALLLGFFLVTKANYQSVGRHVTAGAFFVSNIVLWGESNYFDQFASQKLLLHLWSLGVEEQFYIIWPLLLMILYRLRINLVAAAIVIGVVSFGYSYWITANDPTAGFYSPLSRTWELMAGALLALWRPRLRSGLVAEACPVIGMVLIASACFLLSYGSAVPAPGVALPVAGTMLIIAAGPSPWLNRTLLGSRLFVRFGLISYPLYLWHWPLLALLNRGVLDGLPAAPMRIAAVIVSVVLAELTYRLVEYRPEGRRNYRVTALVGLMGIVALGGLWVARDGMPWRAVNFDPRLRFVASYEDYIRNSVHARSFIADCDFYDAANLRAKTAVPAGCTPTGTANTVLLWGDSHAAALSRGIRSILPPGTALAMVSTSGCNPRLESTGLQGVGFLACDRNNRHALAAIAKLKPRIVILAQRNGHEDVDWTRIAHALHALGVVHVVLVGPTPQWWPSLPRIAARHWDESWTRIADGLVPASAATDALLQQRYARAFDLRYVSLTQPLCNAQGCVARVPGEKKSSLLVIDYGHLSAKGSRYIARTIIAPVILPMLEAR